MDFTNPSKAFPKDSFSLPWIDLLIDMTSGHEFLSFMDSYLACNQIRMYQHTKKKTAFITNCGLYCYKVMLFGLKNVGATYQLLVNRMFTN